MIDFLDKKILALLQSDWTLSVNEIADRVGLSPTPCWRRMRKLEASGFIKKRVAILDEKMLNVGVTVFITVRSTSHSMEWNTRFLDTVKHIPEIVGIYRLSGDVDYLIKATIPDVAAYGSLYNRLVEKVNFLDVCSMFVIEDVKATTELPLTHV